MEETPTESHSASAVRQKEVTATDSECKRLGRCVFDPKPEDLGHEWWNQRRGERCEDSDGGHSGSRWIPKANVKTCATVNLAGIPADLNGDDGVESSGESPGGGDYASGVGEE